MTLSILREFLLWCAVINVGLLLLSFLFIAFAHDFIYRLHGRWFRLSEEAFSTTMYRVLGIYKIMILFFNVVPYVALRIIE